MKEQFFYYQGWYYPINSVSFRLNAVNPDREEFAVSMFHLHERKAVQVFEGRKAKQVMKLLDTLSIDLETLDEVEE